MKEFIEQIGDYLSENYIIAAAAAGVVLLIIIIAAIVKNSKKNSSGGEELREKEFFLEGEYDSMLKDTAAARRKAAAEETAKATACEQPEPEQPQPSAEAADETACSQEDDLQPVQININIGKGQVILGYEEDGQIRCTVKAEQEDAEEFQALEEELAGMGTGKEAEAPMEQKEPETAPAPGIVLEKINLVRGTPAKKFGPDNFNTGRSGRVFTEEELKIQIKE